jgi:hypothetical protein
MTNFPTLQAALHQALLNKGPAEAFKLIVLREEAGTTLTIAPIDNLDPDPKEITFLVEGDTVSALTDWEPRESVVIPMPVPQPRARFKGWFFRQLFPRA